MRSVFVACGPRRHRLSTPKFRDRIRGASRVPSAQMLLGTNVRRPPNASQQKGWHRDTVPTDMSSSWNADRVDWRLSRLLRRARAWIVIFQWSAPLPDDPSPEQYLKTKGGQQQGHADYGCPEIQRPPTGTPCEKGTDNENNADHMAHADPRGCTAHCDCQRGQSTDRLRAYKRRSLQTPW